MPLVISRPGGVYTPTHAHRQTVQHTLTHSLVCLECHTQSKSGTCTPSLTTIQVLSYEKFYSAVYSKVWCVVSFSNNFSL